MIFMPKQYELYRACKSGDLTKARALIESGQASPNEMIHSGLDNGPVLKFAAESGNLELVQYLYEVCEVNVEAKGKFPGTQDTALSRAARKGHLDISIYLMDKGADPNSNISYGTILVNAIQSKNLLLVQELFNRGARIGYKEIHYALEEGYYEMTLFLLDNRMLFLKQGYIDPFVQDAAKGGCVKTLKHLEENCKLDLFETGSSLNKNKGRGYGIIKAALEGGNLEMVKYLVEERGIDIAGMVLSESSGKYAYKYNAYDTLLGKAIKSKNPELIIYLFETLSLVPPTDALKHLKKETAEFCGIEINAYLESYLVESLEEKRLLLQLAKDGLSGLRLSQILMLYNLELPKKGSCSNCNDEISSYVNQQKITARQVPRLLQQESQEEFGINLFCYFANCWLDYDFREHMSIIMQAGISVNAVNRKGQTPLHLSIAARGYSTTTQWLLENGANPDLPNHNGVTAINMMGRMLGFDKNGIIVALEKSTDYTNSLKQTVQDWHDCSLPYILKHSKGEIGGAKLEELLVHAIKTEQKLEELLRYVSTSIYQEMKSLLTNADFISQFKDKEKLIARTIHKIEEQRDLNFETRNTERMVVDAAADGLFLWSKAFINSKSSLEEDDMGCFYKY